MALLAYCIVEAGADIEVPATGVQETPIRTVSEAGLQTLVSEYLPPQGGEQADVRTTALAFNNVLQAVLRQVAIVPFRFPTILGDESEISSFLRERTEEYRKALDRLRTVVQMEINIGLRTCAPEKSMREASGAEYLRSRQAHLHRLAELAQTIRQRLAPWIQDWHEGSSGTRGYALVARSAVQDFLNQAKQIQLPSDLQARVTGPWPATEFLKER